MPTPYTISIMAQDRVGIVADVTGAIQALHGNLQDMSQTVLRGYFTMILLATFPDGTEEETLRKALHAVKGLSQFEIGVLPFIETQTETKSEDENEDTYVLTASGPDKEGLVSGISSYLRMKGINIIDLATHCDQGIYTMMLVVSLPAKTDVGKLKKSLGIAMEQYGLTVGLRHQALFRKANEI